MQIVETSAGQPIPVRGVIALRHNGHCRPRVPPFSNEMRSTLELNQADIDRTAEETRLAVSKVVFPHALEAAVETEG